MSAKIYKTPDIGDGEAEVIEILVKVGDELKAEGSVLVLESDKASMEIPAEEDGKVSELLVKVGDKVTTGSPIYKMLASNSATPQPSAQTTVNDSQKGRGILESNNAVTEISAEQNTHKAVPPKDSAQEMTEQKIVLPDIGTDEAEVIEILVKVGEKIEVEQNLIALESDKASMEVPSPHAGEIVKTLVKVGDKVKQDSQLFVIKTKAANPNEDKQPATANKSASGSEENVALAKKETAAHKTSTAPSTEQAVPVENAVARGNKSVYAGPAVRKLAREFGINLELVAGSGNKNRILKEDLQKYVKKSLQSGSHSSADNFEVFPPANVNFAEFGEIERKPMSKIQRLTAEAMARSIRVAPQVTHFEQVDISELEKFRQQQKKNAAEQGIKLTIIPFLLKATANTLIKFPEFRVSLDGDEIIEKKYCHIGLAIDNPYGLTVPVIRNVNAKSIYEIAQECQEIINKSHKRQLKPQDMQGGCFTLSSLGALGGTYFTPIVNLPEVAILGVSKADVMPKFINGMFSPRTILPISLSYDHRIINGAAAARFASYLKSLLEDIRTLAL